MAKSNSLNADLSNCLGLPLSSISSSTLNSQVISNSVAQASAVSLTNGQVMIGSTGSSPVAALMQAGIGISMGFSPGGISIGRLSTIINIQSFPGSVGSSVSGTYTKSTGAVSCLVICVGGGGSGAGRVAVAGNDAFWYASSGGAGGSCGMKYYSTAPDTATYTAGSGGAASSGVNVGSQSSFSFTGNSLIAGGGRVSSGGISYSSGQWLSSFFPTQETNSTTSAFDYFSYGSTWTYGSVPAAGDLNSNGGEGGASGYGSAGARAGEINENGLAATGYGGGGSGITARRNTSAVLGGAGAPGIVIVFEYA